MVRFIIRHDKGGVLRFASLQSDYARRELGKWGIPEGHFSSIVLIDDKVLFKSDAVLAVARRLSGGWRAIGLLRVLPRFIRDGVYDFVSRHRYRLFGKSDRCTLPTPDLEARFLT
jgi:predicted DCC family thiol-disulfide oxidoreductase YuxK